MILDLRKFLVTERMKFWSNVVWHQLKRDEATFNSIDHFFLLKKMILLNINLKQPNSLNNETNVSDLDSLLKLEFNTINLCSILHY